jgi:hypothetical protein
LEALGSGERIPTIRLLVGFTVASISFFSVEMVLRTVIHSQEL